MKAKKSSSVKTTGKNVKLQATAKKSAFNAVGAYFNKV